MLIFSIAIKVVSPISILTPNSVNLKTVSDTSRGSSFLILLCVTTNIYFDHQWWLFGKIYFEIFKMNLITIHISLILI